MKNARLIAEANVRHEVLINDFSEHISLMLSKDILGIYNAIPKFVESFGYDAQRLTLALPRYIDDVMQTAYKKYEKGTAQLVEFEAKFQEMVFAVGNPVMYRDAIATDQDLFGLDSFRAKAIIDGSFLDQGRVGDYINKYTGKLQKDARQIIQAGFAEGQTSNKIAEVLLNDGFKSNLVDAARHTKTIVRTAHTSVVSDSRKDLVKKSNIAKGLKIRAILDRLTTDICNAKDGEIILKAEMDLAQLPPYHFNCRTTVIPFYSSNQMVYDMKYQNWVEVQKDGADFKVSNGNYKAQPRNLSNINNKTEKGLVKEFRKIAGNDYS